MERAFIAGKKFTLFATDYEPGDEVDISSLPIAKQRMLQEGGFVQMSDSLDRRSEPKEGPKTAAKTKKEALVG